MSLGVEFLTAPRAEIEAEIVHRLATGGTAGNHLVGAKRAIYETGALLAQLGGKVIPLLGAHLFLTSFFFTGIGHKGTSFGVRWFLSK
jgi:hypothetical protein